MPAMLEKLRALADRFDELERALSTPEVASDPVRSRTLARERGALQRKVEAYREYEAVRARREGAEQILARPDDRELRELAEAERDEASRREAELIESLRRLLVDDDPN